MYSISSPAAAAGSEARSSPQEGHFPPPPLAGPVSPRRRNHAAQPPALTIAINSASIAGYSATPLSTTSLSSPFSQNMPASAQMALRQSSAVSAQYNPREWAPPSSGTSQGERAGNFGQTRPVQYARADGDVVASPPPPYSPRPDQSGSRKSTVSILSPSNGNASSSQRTTPTSSSFFVNPPPPSTSRSNRPRPVSIMLASDGHLPLPPPPPGPPSRGSSASRIESEVGQGRLSFGNSVVLGGSTHPNTETVIAGNGATPMIAMTAPAARRAASAGVMTSSTGSSRASSHDGSRSPSRKPIWEPGMPLPGPPPLPPPAASRSQSASGVTDAATRYLSASGQRPKSRLPPQMGTTLGPVPPTPAGWVDDDQQKPLAHVPSNLHINTTNVAGRHIFASPEPVTDSQSTTSGLFRSSAVRDPAGKGIRERRSSSRHAKNLADGELSALSISTNPWAEAMSAREQDTDPEDFPDDMPQTTLESSRSRNIGSATSQNSAQRGESSRSTPLASSVPLHMHSGRSNHTPPFSPGVRSSSPAHRSSTTSSMTSRALQTPPLHIRTQSPTITRPISHILHLPNDMSTVSATPSSPQVFSPLASTNTEPENLDDKAFMSDAARRHEDFLRKEHAAADDEERLRLFADFILVESRIRRRRYSKAWVSGRFDVRGIREKLFEQAPQLPRRSSGLSEVVSASPTNPTPPSSGVDRPESAWWSSYQPVLSPIAGSMSLHDEQSSRGRTPSRWWESQTGSQSAGGERKLERSKRESKYMGVPREAREAMQQAFQDPDTPRRIPAEHTEDGRHGGYPAEKTNLETFGFYDDAEPSPLPPRLPKQPESPNTLDVSRFITLPPPYPRHYPAVSNSHPDLVEYRTAVRTMSDLSEIAERKTRSKASIDALRKDAHQKIAESRKSFRANIHAQITDSSITFAEAAEAEQAMKEVEYEAEKRSVQAEFDCFQDVVLNPLHGLLNDRVAQLSHLIDDLQHKLFSDAQDINPDREQEAGDEEPELLEKLNQLKWLFETREQTHREIFGLLTERNDKYKEIVLLPYRQTNNEQKLRNTDAFFVQDNKDRQKSFENESLARYQEFARVIEGNVGRGIELQSSAFWDIAPALCDLLSQIPERLDQFEGIRIPEQELEENHQYYNYPFQYLYSVLQHAEQSTYQFIESQINLHCLLHEVKNGVLTARCRAIAAERVKLGQDSDAKQVENRDEEAFRANEEAALTADLQQKVSMTEQQWLEALGGQLQATRGRVREWLVQEGGWEDGEQIQE